MMSTPDSRKVAQDVEGTTILHIRLASDGNWPPVAFEEIEAFPLGEDRFRLASPPAFAKRLAVGDTVRIARYGSPEVPWIDGLVEKSGHSTIRVIFFKSAGEAPEGELRLKMRQLGVSVVETSFDGLVAMDVPADVDYGAVLDYLASGEERKLWEFEEAAVSPSHDAER